LVHARSSFGSGFAQPTNQKLLKPQTCGKSYDKPVKSEYRIQHFIEQPLFGILLNGP
jgi:hypothetical protein